MNGLFGNMFDFNGDGKLSFLEQAAEFAFLDMLIEEDQSDEGDDDD